MNRREIEKAKLKTKEWEDKVRKLSTREVVKKVVNKIRVKKRWHKKRFIVKKVIKKKWTYKEYILSNEWSKLRFKVLKRAKGLCEVCKTNRAWQVHHKTYKRLFHEKLSDLIALCGTCHQDTHNLLTEEQIEMATEKLLIKNGFIN